ncbi:LacI family DNA-binding transcriptional regulator [Pelomonas sp. SE-A7]|uniref:LacI family DNA-binding transcriptional regulator n=1 Tax=Pelomonas sp. SE-A7 TaxID=3054953 RepID=UPI00259CB6B4|nr:LacI family DNA-binding transcriptional regulator [Pelomonas sp. SE-A7]MDM4765195.1 LacI family DNA-binding transcriptional regulator [Pelomonas sp. SE-A7]
MNTSSSPPRRMRHAATLADVGREAGVSAMAASAVLNGARTSARISEEARQRILAAAERLRYRPNATARALAEGRMNTIGVATTLSRNELNQYFLEVFNGVIEAAAEEGQNTTVYALPDWRDGAKRIPAICDGRIDGLILLAPLLDREAAQHLPEHTPLVSIHANCELPGVTNLESEEESGAHAAVKQMLSLGHQRILHVGGPIESLGAARRVTGYRRAHAELGIKPAADHVIHGDFTVESGRRTLEHWLRRHAGEPLPQALFAGSDAIALGCLETLRARGLRVPDDISLMGFDDTLLARSAHLATVRQPLRELGHRAVRMLVWRIDAKWRGSNDIAPTSIVLPTELVPGATLAPPRTTPLTIA